MKKNTRSWLNSISLLLMAFVLLALAGCDVIKGIDFPWEEPAGVPTKTPVIPTATATTAPTQAQIEPTSTATAQPRQTRFVFWLPPEFDPEADNEAARLLKARLANFAKNNRVEIVVRLKNPTGNSNLIESLIATNGAAPENLPGLVLLRKQDLDLALSRNLLYSNNELIDLAGGMDWYSFARETVNIDGESYGLGLIGDPMIMAYQIPTELPPDDDWFELASNFGRFGFAADDSQGRFMLMLYLAAGGETQDAQKHVVLQAEPITRVFQTLKDLVTTHHLHTGAAGMQTVNAVWQGFSERQLNTAAMPASVVLKTLRSEATGYPTPAFTQPSFTLADAWALALANPDEGQQALGILLMQDLTEPAFLAKWSEALGYVPARPSALGAWTDQNLKPALEKIMNVARLYPRDEIINSLGPVLRNATLMIIRDNASVEEAVEAAIEGIK